MSRDDLIEKTEA